MPVHLGDITFGIGADTTRLASSISELQRFGSVVEQVSQRAAQGIGVNVANALRRQEQAMITALQKVQKYQDQVAKLGAPAQLSAGLNQMSTEGLDKFVSRMASGRLSALQFQREMERFSQTMTNAQRIMGNWVQAERTAAQGSMVGHLQKLSGAAVLVAGPLSGIATRISVITSLADHFSLAWAGMIAGIAAGAYTFYKFATSVVDVEKKLQNIEQTLIAVTSSVTVSHIQMKYLAEFADRAGVKMDDLAKNYAQITAAAKGTNLEGERTNKIFEGITLAGGKLGLSSEDIKGSLLAVQQMISKGQIQMEELKGQLGDRLPGAVKAFADSLGVTEQKFNKMVKAGEVTSSMLVGFVETLTKRYGINENTKIDTITAAENRLANARIRMVDALDRVIGLSTAYQNVLKMLTDGINGASTRATEFVRITLQVGAALATAFLASTLLPALANIANGIIRLSAAIVTLNVATAAGAFSSFVRLLATAAIGVAAYYGSEKMIGEVMSKSSQSFLNAVPAVEEYIKSQKELVSTVRGPTLQYIEEEKKKLDELTAKRKQLTDQAAKPLAEYNLAEGLGATNQQLDALAKNNGMLSFHDAISRVDKSIETTKQHLVDLNDVLRRQTEAESKNRADPAKELTTRQTLAIKNANDTVKELTATYENLFKAPAAREWDEIQNSINKQVENFRDTLSRTELPAEKVTELTEKYASALRKVKEASYTLAHTVSSFQAIEGIFSRGLDKGLDEWINTIVEGKDQLQALKDVAKAVAADILKTFMTLAALNPIKNALFGTNYSTLGGGAGIGGLLGSFFGGGYSGAASGAVNVGSYSMPTIGYSPFASGGIMTSQGPKPLRRYASGGIARGSQFAEFGEGSTPEAYVPLPDGRSIPVKMEGAAGGVAVHIHEAQGVKAKVSASQGAQGERIDIHLQRIAVGGAIDDIANGGALSQLLEKQYGLRRTAGMAT